MDQKLKIVLYSKDFAQDKTWGRFFGASDPVGRGRRRGQIHPALSRDRSAGKGCAGGESAGERSRPLRIYQLFVRLFGNTNETRKQNGTLAENGVGKFDDINDAALECDSRDGFHSHLADRRAAAGHRTDYSDNSVSRRTIRTCLRDSPAALTRSRITSMSAPITRSIRRTAGGIQGVARSAARHQTQGAHRLRPESCRALLSLRRQTRHQFRHGRDDRVEVSSIRDNNFFYLQPDADGPPLQVADLARWSRA